MQDSLTAEMFNRNDGSEPLDRTLAGRPPCSDIFGIFVTGQEDRARRFCDSRLVPEQA